MAELEAAIAASRERCAALRAAEQHDVQGGTALLGSNGAAGASSSSAGGPAGAGPQAQQAGAAAAAGPAEAPSDGASTAGTLAERLAAAYQAAGFALDASVTPLQMLQKVEAALEECLVAIGPPGSPGALAAEAVERARERERRQVARATKLAARQAEHVCWGTGRLCSAVVGQCLFLSLPYLLCLLRSCTPPILAPADPFSYCTAANNARPLIFHCLYPQEARIQRVLERAAAPKFQKKVGCRQLPCGWALAPTSATNLL